ncbi:multidrug DMT transporter permease [Photorhabdus temperata]|uniref:Putative permease, DMT superfamily n=1 Tax=Photorhabdus khanii NC19 TaxID=1004151 RepID=W3V6V4_9GAMM|nr:DMT family transporter [Photorhabdus khanii]ETS31671.1 putative permease, DMT superfamily [Photorhabdus khanii NC19]OHV58872.1 multidrug DMT transporter permease [Photorhabdus temperata]
MISKAQWISYSSTLLFVLLWSSGAIFSRWGLDHSTAFAILTMRFAIALIFLIFLGLLFRRNRHCLPVHGTRKQIAGTGVLLIGGYSICYFFALDNGITPGVLATVMGIQPIITLLVIERRFSIVRLAGLLLALLGLILVVYQSLVLSRFSFAGITFALAALVCMSFGAILQKRIHQAPSAVLPLQYSVSLLLCLLFVPFQPFEFQLVPGFIISLLWLGLVISVVAQLLLYRLIQRGNLVNVTSLFYLVPGVTAIMDYLFLGNSLPALSLLGMAAILSGLVLVFRTKKISLSTQ